MTKRDLLHFLEPFTDDIQLVVKAKGGTMADCEPRYEMRKHCYRLPSGVLLDEGDGIVVLEERP